MCDSQTSLVNANRFAIKRYRVLFTVTFTDKIWQRLPAESAVAFFKLIFNKLNAVLSVFYLHTQNTISDAEKIFLHVVTKIFFSPPDLFIYFLIATRIFSVTARKISFLRYKKNLEARKKMFRIKKTLFSGIRKHFCE